MDCLHLCLWKGRVPLRNHMEIAVTSEIFLNRLGYKCLQEVEILVLQKLSFSLVTYLFPKFSAETSDQRSHCYAAPEVTCKAYHSSEAGTVCFARTGSPSSISASICVAVVVTNANTDA